MEAPIIICLIYQGHKGAGGGSKNGAPREAPIIICLIYQDHKGAGGAAKMEL